MTRRPARAAGLLLAATFTLAAACSRAVSVGSAGPGPAATAYAVNVTNAGSVDLAVGYDDGSGNRALGLVRAARTERFIIASPRRTIVRITGATPDGSYVANPVSVELRADSPVDVTLR
jgi:hypothetical protein